MATRSTIWIKNADNTYIGIYCHWAGYLTHNGRILFEHYSNESKVRELIAFGSASCIEEECSQPIAHTFDNPIPGYSVFYARDRGEKVKQLKALNEFQTQRECYNYIFQDGKWFFSTGRHNYQPLTLEILQELQNVENF